MTNGVEDLKMKLAGLAFQQDTSGQAFFSIDPSSRGQKSWGLD